MARFFRSKKTKGSFFIQNKMLGSFFKKHIFLLISLVLLLLAVYSYRFGEERAPISSERHYGNSVQDRVHKSLELASQELTMLTGHYQKSDVVNFSSLKLETNYPYYIYRNGEIIFWSDHRYIPEYEWIEGLYDNGLLAKNNHISLAKKQVFYHNKNKLELVELIPIYEQFQNENDYLKSGFDKSLFPTSPLTIENTASNRAYLNIHDDEQRFLFSIIPPREENLNSPDISNDTLILISIGLLFLGLYLLIRISFSVNQHSFEFSAFLLLAYLASIRWFMLANSLPFAFNDSDLFNPKFFAIDSITPSLGDLIINTLFITLFIAYIAFYLYKSWLYRLIIKSPKAIKSIVSVLMILMSMAVTYLGHEGLSSLFEKSSYILDYSFSTTYSSLKLATLVFFLLLAFLFFLLHHIFSSIFVRLNIDLKTSIYHWIYGILLSLFLFIYFDISWTIFVLTSIYIGIIYYFRFPQFLYTFRYQTSIYFFLGAFVYTLLANHVLRKESIKKDVFDKQNYGMRYLAENDALGEGLLNKVIVSIQTDSSVRNAIIRPSLAKEAVKGLVKNKHLDIYFDKYNSDVYSFDIEGNQLGIGPNLPSLSTLEAKYKQNRYSTGNQSIFFINETGEHFIKQYIVFVPLEEGFGTVIIDLKLRDEYAESVYPELLMEKKFVQNPESKTYSYAIYDQNNQLVYSFGKFNFLKSIEHKNLDDLALFTTGIHLSDYDHVGVKSANGRKIIVSSENEIWKNLLSNFSFLYLLLVLVISLIILIYGFRVGLRGLKMNFSTKIQIYLNAAFLLPFLLVLFVLIGVIRNTLLNIQENFYLENTKNISSTVQIHLQNLNEGKSSRAFFEQEVDKLAKDTKSDINYFDLNGELVYSTRPLIYDYHLLSKRINPDAFERIIEDLDNEILVNESLGKLNYKTVYLSVKDIQNKRLGVIGIPFFDSSVSLSSLLTGVFTTILRVCIAIFLILLILSYFVANQLTNPLKMVAQRIKKTSLNKQNEPIKWEVDDEIGVLTSSYNNMLKKLEESKDALSQSEKQSAWREMAKQVAHEIKNPLTPMKLSIQQLQRTLPSLDEKPKKRIERALNSLAEQIDNISEIANSFSEFAKMPVPRSEIFDLVGVVQKTAYLYAQNNDVELTLTALDKNLFVKSDHQLINRVITNLIINGMQSVEAGKKPVINIKVYRNNKEKFAMIEVTDNGSGILESHRDKVFMPNFSTKVGGSGLGLAMAKRGVEHSGGNLWFETEVGHGTTFYVDLPLVKRESDEVPT